MRRKRKVVNKSRLAADRAVRDAKRAERELERELAKMGGPLTDDDADDMVETLDSDEDD